MPIDDDIKQFVFHGKRRVLLGFIYLDTERSKSFLAQRYIWGPAFSHRGIFVRMIELQQKFTAARAHVQKFMGGQ